MSDDHKNQTLPAVVERRELENREQVNPLVQAVMQSGQEMTPDVMREMLALQREWEAGEARKAYVRAMAECKAVLRPVLKKDKTNKHHGWTYTSIEEMIRHITEPLSAFGFSVGGSHRRLENGNVEVTSTITHTLGHVESVTIDAPPDFGKKTRSSGEYSRNEPQAVQATITSLRRSNISTLLNLGSSDLEDANSTGVDLVTNVRALEALEALGKTRDDIEHYLCDEDGEPKSMHLWTVEDVARLRQWARELKS